MFKKLLLAATISSAALLSHVNANADDAAKNEETITLSKTEFESTIKKWILNNPEVIIESLQQAEQRQANKVQETAKLAVKENIDEIINDPSNPAIGPDDADVTIVEFFDYNCGYCKYMIPTINKVMENDKKVRFIFKETPILGPDSTLASTAALAVNNIDKDKYFAFHQKMMEYKGRKNKEAIRTIAEQVGVDADKLVAELDKGEYSYIINKNLDLFGKVARGTPAFIINDELIPGAADYDRMVGYIKEVRNKAAEKATEQN